MVIKNDEAKIMWDQIQTEKLVLSNQLGLTSKKKLLKHLKVRITEKGHTR